MGANSDKQAALTTHIRSTGLPRGSKTPPMPPVAAPAPEYTGGSVSYYKARIEHPTTKDNPPYTAECNDIIEALGMNYAEANVFKAVWRSCAARMGLGKKGYVDGLYDAEKIVFFGERMVHQAKLQTCVAVATMTLPNGRVVRKK